MRLTSGGIVGGMAGSKCDRRPEPHMHPSIEVRKVSEREFCEHLGIEDVSRFIGVQHMRQSKMLWILLEKEG